MSVAAPLAPTPGRRAGRDPRAVARELRILLRFRLSAGGRDPRRSVALIVVLVVVLGVGVPLSVASFTQPGAGFEAQLLTPTAWSAFLLTACLASIASAGGRELLPRDRAVAFPVSAAADHAGALLLAPLNVAWSAQAVSLMALTAYGVGWRATLLQALLATLLWIVTVTCAGQLVGWGSEVVRTFRYGRVAIWVVGALGSAAALIVVASGRTLTVLDRLPTTYVYVSAVTPDLGRFVATQAAVVAAAVVCGLAAVPLVEKLSLRPSMDRNRSEARQHLRRRQARTDFLAAVALDSSSVRRSPPLARGLLLLVLTPLAIVAIVQLPWSGLTLLPGLVAAGTSLLYGVNLAALDGRGALWRESLPESPDSRFWARTAVLAATCAIAVALVVATAAIRATAAPSTVEWVTVALAVLVATSQAVSRCTIWSLRHPFAAGLQHPRDTPAPPTRMAGYSLRLSVATTLGAVALIGAAISGMVTVVLLVSVLLLLPGVLRLLEALHLHRDHSVRERVASAVSGT